MKIKLVEELFCRIFFIMVANPFSSYFFDANFISFIIFSLDLDI